MSKTVTNLIPKFCSVWNIVETLRTLASLIQERNETEKRISAVTGRPASIGHLGEFIASHIFDIRLAESANYKNIDGWFESGPLAGKSVNIKWYAKHEGILDMCIESGPDYYLVLAGPNQAPIRARGPRSWLIESAYLMEDSVLRGLVTSKIGVATSIRREVWKQHQIFPMPNPALMMLSDDQTQALRLFGASPI